MGYWVGFRKKTSVASYKVGLKLNIEVLYPSPCGSCLVSAP